MVCARLLVHRKIYKNIVITEDVKPHFCSPCCEILRASEPKTLFYTFQKWWFVSYDRQHSNLFHVLTVNEISAKFRGKIYKILFLPFSSKHFDCTLCERRWINFFDVRLPFQRHSDVTNKSRANPLWPKRVFFIIDRIHL